MADGTELETRLRRLAVQGIELTSYEDLVDRITADAGIEQNRPEMVCQVDPRTGARVVYSKSRARRPHEAELPRGGREAACPVCAGQVPAVIDVAPLSRGYTFITANLFPVVHPADLLKRQSRVPEFRGDSLEPDGQASVGMHFVQWLSTYHDADLHTMPAEDIAVVLGRLALLEERLLHSPGSNMSRNLGHSCLPHHGFVGVIQNVGALVGSSLGHGHLQVLHTNILPARVQADAGFMSRVGLPFAQFVRERGPAGCRIATYDDAMEVCVPYFLKRPLECLIVPRSDGRAHVHELSAGERLALAKALRDVVGAVRKEMPRLGRALAYNIIMHEGPVGTMYVEMLPYTQEIGGYEQLGLYLCQGTPGETVGFYRRALSREKE